MKSVAIIVVTYNRLKLLQEEIEALRKQTYTDFQIVVINNGSTDNTLEWLGQQSDIITITQENLGGAGGFHTGMKYAAENGYEFCWIMDDDVICSENALMELHKAYHIKENIGFVCSKVIGIDGNPMNTPFVDERPTNNGYPDYSDLIEHQMIKIKEATFVSVFLSTDTICKVGLPYKEYFIWGDDSEYTQRISLNSSSYMACKSIVTHKRAIQGGLDFYSETSPSRIKNYFFMFRNQCMNAIKYSNGNRIRLSFRQFRTAIWDIMRLKFPHAKIRFKAAIALVSFKPQLIYPSKNK